MAWYLKTFDKAVKANPEPILFFTVTEDISIPPEVSSEIGRSRKVQSMSRVAHCTDNGVMEGFWGS